jgi:chemotaxis protein MotB
MTTKRFRPQRASSDRWLVSYADFSTLLFALFATMYAISNVDAKHMPSVAEVVQSAFPDARGRSIVPPAGVLPEPGASRKPIPGPAEDIRQIVARELAAEIKMRRVDLGLDHRGVILSIPESGLFAIGSDQMSANARALMIRIAAMLARLEHGNAIRVEGHTDDTPVHSARFRSNWDLSTARATEVVTLLVDRGISPARLSAAGYAEFHPRTANRSADDRAMNRRVDLVILNDTTARSEEPALPLPEAPRP